MVRWLIGALLLPLLSGCLEGQPQIVDISPQRNAAQVRSNQAIRITFDRPVDHGSVSSRFRLEPKVAGTVSWTGNAMVFEHPPLATGTTYQAILEPGYRDLGGQTVGVRHSWPFTTELPPHLTSSSPASDQRGVDPAAYLSLAFEREMNVSSLARAVGLSPSLPISIRADPADRRRALVVPQALLNANQPYRITVSEAAQDIDGNPLARAMTIDFQTGPVRPFQHLIGFVAKSRVGAIGSGVWVVDENRVPRQVLDAPATQFSWSRDGLRMLVQGENEAWADVPLAGTSMPLGFTGRWAAALAGDQGYLFIRGDQLYRWSPRDRMETVLATSVGEATLAPSPGPARVAYTVRTPGGMEIRAIDLDLNAGYRLAEEHLAISNLSWSPDGNGLSYQVEEAEPGQSKLRVRSLSGTAQTTTVASGRIRGAMWRPDSAQLIVNALVSTSSGPAWRIYPISVAGPSEPLSPDRGLPHAPTSLEALSPAVSPKDGHQIAFLGRRDGIDQVWIMNYDGTGLTQLTSWEKPGFPYSCQALIWSLG